MTFTDAISLGMDAIDVLWVVGVGSRYAGRLARFLCNSRIAFVTVLCQSVAPRELDTPILVSWGGKLMERLLRPEYLTAEDLEIVESEAAEPLFVTGFQPKMLDQHTVRIIGWYDHQALQERHFRFRAASSILTAERLYVDLWKLLRQQKRRAPTL